MLSGRFTAVPLNRFFDWHGTFTGIDLECPVLLRHNEREFLTKSTLARARIWVAEEMIQCGADDRSAEVGRSRCSCSEGFSQAGIIEQTFYRRKAKYAGLEVVGARDGSNLRTSICASSF